MKNLLMALCLVVSSLSYSNDYVLNEDGSMSYVGSCSLHMDYEDKHFYKTATMLDYVSLEMMQDHELPAFVAKLPAKARTLIEKTYFVAYDERPTGSAFIDYFDDLEVFTIFMISPETYGKMAINVVSYGVGGGNGGYMFFDLDDKLIAHNFDQELIFCDKDYLLK